VLSEPAQYRIKSMKWILGFAFALITAPLAADEGRTPEIAAFAHPPAIAGATEPAPRGSAGPAKDYRVMWADPAIRDFIGLSENGWDFAKPESIPGFGPLPDRADTR
jgi:hypothetical protein